MITTENGKDNISNTTKNDNVKSTITYEEDWEFGQAFHVESIDDSQRSITNYDDDSYKYGFSDLFGDENITDTHESKEKIDKNDNEVNKNSSEDIIGDEKINNTQESKKEIDYKFANILMKHIRYLEKCLSQCTTVNTFNPKFKIKINESNSINKDQENENIFFDSEYEEENYQHFGEIGRGEISIVYKLIDKKTLKPICKKVLKVDKATFKMR